MNEIVKKPFYRSLHAVSSINLLLASDILNSLVVNVCDIWSITVMRFFVYQCRYSRLNVLQTLKRCRLMIYGEPYAHKFDACGNTGLSRSAKMTVSV